MRESITRKVAQDTADKLFCRGPTTAENQLARLRWAIDFAQGHAGQLEDRIALTLFPDGSVAGESGRVFLLTEDETAQARRPVLAVLRKWVEKGFYKIAK